MPKSFFKVPDNLVEEWPEIFEDMWISTMPVDYLHTLQIEFTDGRVWEIDISEKMNQEESELLSKQLKETFVEYRDTIKTVQFQMNVKKLKKDIQHSTKHLL